MVFAAQCDLNAPQLARNAEYGGPPAMCCPLLAHRLGRYCLRTLLTSRQATALLIRLLSTVGFGG